MLTHDQQLTLADQLATLRDRLILDDPTIQIKDINKQVLEQLHKAPLLGPITSSGLEHVYQIFNRLDTIVYALRSKRYQTDGKILYRIGTKTMTIKPRQQQKNAETPPAPIRIKRPHTPSTLEKNPHTLDFGPYDPRKENS